MFLGVFRQKLGELLLSVISWEVLTLGLVRDILSKFEQIKVSSNCIKVLVLGEVRTYTE